MKCLKRQKVSGNSSRTGTQSVEQDAFRPRQSIVLASVIANLRAEMLFDGLVSGIFVFFAEISPVYK